MKGKQREERLGIPLSDGFVFSTKRHTLLLTKPSFRVRTALAVC